MSFATICFAEIQQSNKFISNEKGNYKTLKLGESSDLTLKKLKTLEQKNEIRNIKPRANDLITFSTELLKKTVGVSLDFYKLMLLEINIYLEHKEKVADLKPFENYLETILTEKYGNPQFKGAITSWDLPGKNIIIHEHYEVSVKSFYSILTIASKPLYKLRVDDAKIQSGEKKAKDDL